MLHRNFLRFAMFWLGVTIASTPLFASAAYVSTYDTGGWVVNANTISNPNNAWLNGGPENDKAKGMTDGLYFYQVTDPSGKTLLSTDDIGCRVVEVINGVVARAPLSNDPRLTGIPNNPLCFHQSATALGLPTVPGQGGNPLVLMPFADTPAQGGNYKMWLVPVASYDQTCTITAGRVTDSTTCTGTFGFPNSSSITDNFKIICQPSSITGSTKANGGSGYVVGDTGTIDGSTTADPATYVIASVDNTGAVTGYVITYTGSGYTNSTGYSTTKTTGNGIGFTITTTTIGGDTCTGNANPAFIISGVKFNDVNQNGLRDNGEPLLAGWTVNVTVGQTTTPIVTDANGNWSIALAPTVPFQACEVMQTGWLQSAPNANYPKPTQGSTLVADPGNSSLKCWSDVTPSADTPGYDFGNYQLSDLGVAKTASPAFTRTYNWSITKSSDKDRINIPNGQTATFNYTVGVSETGFTDSAWAVNGTISVTNPNKLVDFTGVNVTDQIDNNGNCVITGGSGNGVSETIAANTTVNFAYTCTFAANPNSGTNTAKATWPNTFVTPDPFGQGTAGYTFGAPTTRVNQSVTVTDTYNGSLGTAGAATDATPYYSTSYQYQRQIAGVAGACTDYGNTATITQTSQKADKSVKVCVGLDLTVAKTAVTNFTSAINKSVDKPLVEQAGGNITLNYTVNVTESNWTVSGKITVTNPNKWEDIVANVGDQLGDTTGVCSVTNGTGANIPASTSVDFPYSCSFAASPAAGSGTNTGAATWNNATYFTPTGSGTGQAAYQFTTLTVSDCWGLVGGTPCTPVSLGNVTIPSGKATFTYAHTVANAGPGTCQEYDNTATIKETSQTASASAIQCNTNTGALTKGFWQGPNGQTIIKNSCAPNGGTSLLVFLTGLNPFNESALTTSTTCAKQATYVANVINAGTCTSTSNTCNTMLKAQMLATALDVYYSTSVAHGGGGNLIGAFNGLGNTTPEIGTILIDLSKVCPTISICTTTFEDARPEFGIANPKIGTSVLQMLRYGNFCSVNGNSTASIPQANGSNLGPVGCGAGTSPVSNLGGTAWYAQNKNPKQVYAKDAFDDIDNQMALIAPGNVGNPGF